MSQADPAMPAAVGGLARGYHLSRFTSSTLIVSRLR